MKIAIIGGGVSGIVAARLLHKRHEITIFEANSYLGGHTNTITVESEDGRWEVDTGFIVLNDRSYPNFTRMLETAGVATQPTHASTGRSGHCSAPAKTVRRFRTGLTSSASRARSSTV
jgi:predicted NAD/FAD-binding protein